MEGVFAFGAVDEHTLFQVGGFYNACCWTAKRL